MDYMILAGILCAGETLPGSHRSDLAHFFHQGAKSHKPVPKAIKAFFSHFLSMQGNIGIIIFDVLAKILGNVGNTFLFILLQQVV